MPRVKKKNEHRNLPIQKELLDQIRDRGDEIQKEIMDSAHITLQLQLALD